RELYKLCCEILAEMADPTVTIEATDSVDHHLHADLYIWDYCSNLLPVSAQHHSPARNLFLLQRQDLADFRNRVGVAAAHILLKPIARPTLTAFLGLAISARKEQILSANSLRADRDELLQ